MSVSHHQKRKKRRFHRHGQPSDLPGTIVPMPGSAKPRIQVLQYGPMDCIQSELSDPSKVGKLIEYPGITWIDVEGLGDASLLNALGATLGLHALALEDVVNLHQRPKVEMYDKTLFMVARADLANTFESEQVSLFLGKNFLITFQEHHCDCLTHVRNRIISGKGKIRNCGADYLLYAILDAIIDGYFPLLEEYGERLDALDEQIGNSTGQGLVQQIHLVRNGLLSIRRAVWPLRDAINALIRDSGDLIADDTDLYFRDCYDHTVQIIDVIETDRDLCSDLRDYYLTLNSNRMNQVMKFLTIIATLFIPLSFIAGLYGMNFNWQASAWNMPELNWTYGYPFALSLMAATATGLIYFFWRSGWLGK